MNKAHILQEIKRTAGANGGVPLGFRQFASETGIRKTGWEGRYWARWGEAIREAGFLPNQMKEAYPKEQLLEAYASLAAELNRLPTTADLKLRSNTDRDFPSEKTLRRLGPKSDLVKLLAEHCKGRPAYESIARLCEEYTPRARETEDGLAHDDVQIGFVYLIKSGKFYKIGLTKAVGRRERELAIQLPEQSTTVHVIRTDDPRGIEEYWHKRFASLRKNGEWFELGAAEVAAFKRRKFM
jgi:hypothetical protein